MKSANRREDVQLELPAKHLDEWEERQKEYREEMEMLERGDHTGTKIDLGQLRSIE